MPSPRACPTALLALTLLSLLAGGCANTQQPILRRAAEPARSPALSVAPAGRTLAVGNEAEGIAVDPLTHLAAVGVRQPFGIALVDLGTGVLRRTVPTSGHVRHMALQAPGGPVLVPLEDAGLLLSISLPDGEVVSSTGSADYPHAVAAVGPVTAVVGNERGHRVTLVSRGQVVAETTGLPQPGGAAATGEAVFVVDVAASTLTRLDRESLQRGRSVNAGDGPTHVVTDVRGLVVVVDTRGDALHVFSPNLQLRQTRSLPGTPYGVAYDEVRDLLWVTLTARNEVVALRGSDLTEVRRLPTVRQPNTVGVDSSTGQVVVGSRSDGLLQLLPLD